MIVVTGATGRLGSLILEQLLRSLPADRVGASARDPSKADALARAGVRVRHGDFARPETLTAAFDAARAAGARRIVYTSHMAASPSSLFAPMHSHAAAEDMLRELGVPWTALRNGFYAGTVPMLIGDAASSGTLVAPEDGPVSWTTHRDLAAAAAAVLMSEGRFTGPTPPLTAGEAFDLEDVAAMLGGMGPKHVTRQVITDDELVAGMKAGHVPDIVIGITLGLYRAARAGEFAATDPTLATLLGRTPGTLRDVLTGKAEN